MRMILALTFVACTAVSAVWGQQIAPQSSVADLLAKLHSKDWTERSDAVDEIRTDASALSSRQVQTALLDLLDQENRERDEGSRMRQTGSRPNAATASGEEDVGEGYGEYCAWLAQTVESFASWNDKRQACILVNAAQITYPSSSADAAARARAVMPCLLQMSTSDLTINREITIPMLAEALEKATGAVDKRTTQTAKEIMLGDLRDPNVGVRASAVDALRQFGTSDMIPALEEVAGKDPTPEVDGHSIRKSAAEAIAAIQKRAQAAN
jgi:hypothetical protein